MRKAGERAKESGASGDPFAEVNPYASPQAWPVQLPADAPPVPDDEILAQDFYSLWGGMGSFSRQYLIGDRAGRPLLYSFSMVVPLAPLAIMLFVVLTSASPLIVLAIQAMRDSLPSVPNIVPVVLAALGLMLVGALYVRMSWFPRVAFYRDKKRESLLFELRQDGLLMPFRPTYSVYDDQQRTLATIEKRFGFKTHRWRCMAPDGTCLAVANPGSFLRNRFSIEFGEGPTRIGEFKRPFMSGAKRRSLDLHYDFNRQLDRRVALALAMLLDTR